MKHIPRNSNLQPFWRCLFLWKWCNPFPRARARVKHAHSFDRCGVSTKNRDLWPSPKLEVRDSPIHRLPVTLRMFRVKFDKSDWFWSQSIVLTKPFKNALCACSESSLTNLVGSGLNLLCLQSHSKTECRWTGPEVAILGADQKERGLWGRECRSYCGTIETKESRAGLVRVPLFLEGPLCNLRLGIMYDPYHVSGSCKGPFHRGAQSFYPLLNPLTPQ